MSKALQIHYFFLGIFSVFCLSNIALVAQTGTDCSNPINLCELFPDNGWDAIVPDYTDNLDDFNNPNNDLGCFIETIGTPTQTSENNYVWFEFKIATSGEFSFVFNPENCENLQDGCPNLDFALFGPYTDENSKDCNNLGSPIRCSVGSNTIGSAFPVTGLRNGAFDEIEGLSNGDGYLAPLDVVAGDTYLMFFNYNTEITEAKPALPFSLSQSGTGSIETDNCCPVPNFAVPTSSCDETTIVLDASGSFNISSTTIYDWSSTNTAINDLLSGETSDIVNLILPADLDEPIDIILGLNDSANSSCSESLTLYIDVSNCDTDSPCECGNPDGFSCDGAAGQQVQVEADFAAEVTTPYCFDLSGLTLTGPQTFCYEYEMTEGIGFGFNSVVNGTSCSTTSVEVFGSDCSAALTLEAAGANGFQSVDVALTEPPTTYSICTTVDISAGCTPASVCTYVYPICGDFSVTVPVPACQVYNFYEDFGINTTASSVTNTTYYTDFNGTVGNAIPFGPVSVEAPNETFWASAELDGCLAFTSFTVNPNLPSPDLSQNSNNNIECEGGNDIDIISLVDALSPPSNNYNIYETLADYLAGTPTNGSAGVDSFNFTPSVAGSYSFYVTALTGNPVNPCESFPVEIVVEVISSFTSTLDITLCSADLPFEVMDGDGNTFSFNDTNLTDDITYTSSLGCDSIVTVNLTINETPTYSFDNIGACIGDAIPFYFNASGGSTLYYQQDGTSEFLNIINTGLDSIVVSNITADVTLQIESIVSVEGCVFSIDEQGILDFATCGCSDPNIITINEDPIDGICEGDIVDLASLVSVSGSFTDTLWSTAGDGVFDANPALNYTFGTNDISNGSVDLTIVAQNNNDVNCGDSTKVITIPILVNTTGVKDTFFCQGADVTVNTETYNTEDTFMQNLTNAAGCDSILTINVIEALPTDTLITDSLCVGSTFSLDINGTIFDEANPTTNGTPIVIQNAAGCDSLINVDLTVLDIPQVVISNASCSGTDFTFEVAVTGISGGVFGLSGSAVTGGNATTIADGGTEIFTLPLSVTNPEIIATLSVAPFCFSATAPITIPNCSCPSVTPASGTQNICSGNIADFDDAITGFEVGADPNGYAGNVIWTIDSNEPNVTNEFDITDNFINETCATVTLERFAWLECTISGTITYVAGGSVFIDVYPAEPTAQAIVNILEACSGEADVITIELLSADGTDVCDSQNLDAPTNETCEPILNETLSFTWADSDLATLFSADASCYNNVSASADVNVYPEPLSINVITDGSACGTPEIELIAADNTVCFTESNGACANDGDIITIDFSDDISWTPPSGCILPTLSESFTCAACFSCPNNFLSFVNPQPTICEGESINLDTISVTLNTDITFTFYENDDTADPPIGAELTGAATEVSPTSDTTYWIVGTDTNNCEATLEVEITVNPTPTATAITITECATEASSFNLDAEAANVSAATVTWYNGTPNAGTSITPSNSVDLTGIGSLWALVSDGTCDTAVQNTLVITPEDDASFSYSPTVCTNATSGLLPLTPATINGTFSVDNSATIDAATGELSIAGLTDATTYTITYTTSGPCPSIATTTILAENCANCPTSITASASATNICSLTSISLTATGNGGTSNITTVWTDATGTPVADPTNVTLINNNSCAPETFTFTATATCDDDGTAVIPTANVSITVYPNPPTNYTNYVTISGENTCATSVNIISECEPFLNIVDDTGAFVNTFSQTASAGEGTGTHTYNLSFDYGVNDANCIPNGAVTVPFDCPSGCPNVVDALANMETICEGSSIVLSASTNTDLSFTWTDEDGVVVADIANVIPPYSLLCEVDTATYYLEAICTTDNSVVSEDSINILVYPSSIDITQVLTTTENDCSNSVSINTDCVGFIEVDGGDSVSNTYSPGDSGSATYTISVNYGNTGLICISSATVTLNYNCTNPCQQDFLSLASEPSICQGESVSLDTLSIVSSAGSTTYAYYNDVILSDLITDVPPIVSPTANTQYYIVGTETATSCLDTLPVLITVNPAPTISITASNPPSICGVDDGTIVFDFGTLPNGIYDLDYDENPTGSPIQMNTTGGIDSLTNLASGNFTNIYITANGCPSNLVSTSLSPASAPPAPTVPTILAICIGETPAPVTVTGEAGASFTWFADAALTVPSIVSGTDTWNFNGVTTDSTFYVIQTVAGCPSVAANVFIDFNELPTINVPSISACSSALTNFNLDAENTFVNPTETVAWYDGEPNNGGIQITPATNVDLTAISDLWVLVTGSNSCENSSQVSVSQTTNPTVSITSFTNPSACGLTDGSINLSFTDVDGLATIFYASNPTGIQITVTGGTFSLINLPAGNYDDIQIEVSGCISLLGVSQVLQAAGSPGVPIALGATYCLGETVNAITATGETGATFNWYDVDPSGGGATPIFTGDTWTPSTSGASETITTYVTQTVGTCESGAAVVIVVINSIPQISLAAVNPTTNPSGCGANDGSVDIVFANVPDGTYDINYIDNSGSPAVFTGVLVQADAATISGLAAGNYTDLEITVGTCSSVPNADFTLTEPSTPTVVASGNNPTTCSGTDGSVELDFTNVPDGNYTIFYDDGSWTNVAVAANTALVENLGAGTFGNIYISLNSCESATGTSVTLTEPTAPTLTLGDTTDATTCGGTGGFGLQFTNVSDGSHTINWVGGNQIVNVIGNATVVSPLPTGDYNDITITVNGCTSALGINTTINNPSIPNLLATFTSPDLCGVDNGVIDLELQPAPANGEVLPVTLYGTPPTTINVTFNDGRGEITDLAAGIYNSIEVLINDCIALYGTEIELLLPTAPIANAGTDAEITCDDTNVELNAATSAGGADIQYSWINTATNDATGIEDSTLQNAIVTQAGIYELTVLNTTNNCSTSDIVVVTELTNTMTAINVSVSDACFGESDGGFVINGVSGGSGSFSYKVNNGGFSNVTDYNGLGLGTYNITALDADGCTFTEPITVNEAAEIQFDLGPDITVLPGTEVTISPILLDSNYVAISWLPSFVSPLSCDNCETPSAIIESPTLFTAVLTDDNGCNITDEIFYSTDRTYNVPIPTAFSPNGDGVNELLFIGENVNIAIIKELQIYNRYGGKVYSQSNFPAGDPSWGWDGFFNDKEQELGVYMYYGVVEFVDGYELVIKGNITLIR